MLLEGKLERNIRFCAKFCTSYPKKCTCFPIGDVRDRRRERYNQGYVLSRVRNDRVSLYFINIQRKSWSNEPPKLLACIRFLYKVVQKIGRLRKFNRAPEIEFNFFTVWTIFMKLGTLVHHVDGYKKVASNF